MADPLLIIGASARAAAASARRAGFQPVTIDLYRDRDTQLIAEEAHQIPGFSSELVKLAATYSNRPWLYTGGLEHDPDLVSQLAQQQVLWGSDAATVRSVREPVSLHSACASAGFLFAEARAECPRDADGWLKKPRKSAGGHGIRWARPDEPSLASSYFQRYYPGPSFSAVFFSHAGECHLLGTSRQLIGPQPEWGVNLPEFAYCGNVGPVVLQCSDELRRIGDWLTRTTLLRGLWGIDFGVTGGRPVIFEVNPRYTASVEVLEWGYDFAAFDYFRWAHRGNPVPVRNSVEPKTLCKLVVYAAQEFRFPEQGLWGEPPGICGPFWADLPSVGELCRAGQPVLTILMFSTPGKTSPGIESVVAQLKLQLPLL